MPFFCLDELYVPLLPDIPLRREKVSGMMPPCHFSVSCKGDRVDEILSWLETHCKDGNRPWVALDDLDLLLMNPKLRPPHFVRTRDSIGLTRENADEAIRLLQAQRTGMIRSS